MARIYPFRPLRPNPFYADQLVFTAPQAESVSGDYTQEGGLKPLKTLLETGARQRPETPEGQMMAYRDIRQTLEGLLERDQLCQEETPAIYVYEVLQRGTRQAGIWALAALEDYTSGAIKIHERTFADSVRRIRNYREHTGLEGSPVLLTYRPEAAINRVIAETRQHTQKAVLGNQHGLHKLWRVSDPELLMELQAAFARVQVTYLADGHHRLESAALLAEDQRIQGLPVYDRVSAMYMASDQLRIEEYDRVVLPDGPVDAGHFFGELNRYFFLQEAWNCSPIRPKEKHRFGMCLDGEWYHLLAKAETYIQTDGSEKMDAVVLQEKILAGVFGIHDPGTDARLKCAGGEKAMEELAELLLSHPGAIAFTLCPPGVEELMAAADHDVILPPKSTWIVPKVPYGLLIHRHGPPGRLPLHFHTQGNGALLKGPAGEEQSTTKK